MLLVGVVVGYAPHPSAAKTFEPPKFSEYCPPVKAGDHEWRTKPPGDVGLRTAAIEKLVRDGHSGKLGNLHSVLVVKDGLLVAEAYFRGATRDHCQLIASVTKSLVSILVGMSLERNPGRSVETPLIEFFPRYADAMQRRGEPAITLAHALTMTAGLEWDEYTYPHPDERNPNTQMYRQADLKRFILGRKRVHPPGQTWAYNSGLSVLAGATVRSMTGRAIDKFAETHLFAPLGIDRYHWFKHADGTVFSQGDLLLTPRSLAKIGHLVLSRGEWRGRRIVSRQWLAESTRRHATAQYDLGFGYSWWLGSTVRNGQRIDIVYGSGTGGQRLFIVPKLNMVVVVTAQVFGNRAGPLFAARLLADYLVPAALPVSDPRRHPGPDDTFLAATVGTYVNANTAHKVRITRRDGALILKPDPVRQIGPSPASIKLTAIASTQFQGSWGQLGTIVLDFNTDKSGSVTGGTVNLLLRSRSYRKIE